MKVDLSCPIELWEYELPTAESPTLSFTFFNLGERTISSIQVTVTCYDANDALLSRRVERPMALEALGRQPFAIALPADSEGIEAVNLEIDKVWFEDGSEWRRQQDVRLVNYIPNELPPNRKLEQLQYVAGDDAVGFPSEQENVWICVCGRVNGNDEESCRRCDRSRKDVFARFNELAVQAVIDAREYELEQKARIAREEASRQEFMRQERTRRKKRTRRVRTLVVTTVSILAVLTYLFIVLGLPELRYQTGMSALASGEYASARQTFVDLMDYRDSPDMVRECDLRTAETHLLSGSMSQVDTALAMLEELGDYPGAPEMVREATYQKGLLYMENGEYVEASEIMSGIIDYRNAEEMRNESEYQLAMQAMQAGEYTDAQARFAKLGTYRDAAGQAMEAVYRPAAEMFTNGDYNGAAELFGTIIGYSDSQEQRRKALYSEALRAQNEGEYMYAAERFTMVDNYEDAPEQYRRSVYLAANENRDAGLYDLAVSLYMKIPYYEDAADQIKACTYLPAKALMTDKQYAEAAEMFRQIPDYLDANDLFTLCLYLPAMDAMDAGEYEEAVRLFSQIPEYDDVDKQLPRAQYRLAEAMEASGDLENAANAFAALGDYSDADTRRKDALYALAEQAFAAGEYVSAARQFESLGKHSDAQTRVKECAYELAMLIYDAGEYRAAYDALMDIDDYAPARTKAQEVAYQEGEALTAAGNLRDASEAFARAGKYEDAATREKQSIYQLAADEMKAGRYQDAGVLFDSITGYSDARAKRDESYDLWLAEKAENAQALYDEGDYLGVIGLLGDLDIDALPKQYADLQTQYYEANIRVAREYIAEDKALEAYAYLIASNGYRNAPTLLDKNIYRILGTWETEDGIRYAFYLNGTANLDGEKGYFNMFNPYGISFGETNDPDSMKRILSYVSGSENALRLRVDETQKTHVFTRTKPPEVSETSASNASTAFAPEGLEEPAEGPAVDILQIGGSVADVLDSNGNDATEEDGADE